MKQLASETRWIVGLDWATQPSNIGLCLAERSVDGLQVRELLLGNECVSPVERIAQWVNTLPGSMLLALDAPLGWPEPMGRVLSGHCAGDGVQESANAFFRRTTDDFVWEKLGKRPLEIGADRIARAALSALAMLAELRELTGLRIPAAWAPDEPARVRVIEVYPAATLLASGESIRGYKRDSEDGRQRREELSQSLRSQLHFEDLHHERHGRSDHLLDASICVLAGEDFLLGRCAAPEDVVEASKEGWIWFSQEAS